MSDRTGSLLRRLALGVSGQTFSRVVFALNAAAVVPILIHAWGISGYGQWIALTALSSYLAYSNFGLITTSANDMIMAIGGKDAQRAQRTFQMSMNCTLYGILPALMLFAGVLCVLPVAKVLHLSNISVRDTDIIIALTALNLWVQTVRGLMVAALYATGSYGVAYYIGGVSKLTELALIFTAVSGRGAGPAQVAAIVAAVSFFDLGLVTAFSRRAAKWVKLDLRVWDWAWLRTQAKPAIGFLVSHFSTNGVAIQGPRVVLGALLGGPAVALYAVYATAMRLVDQVMLALVLPLEVEIARQVGQGDARAASRIIVLGTQVCWWIFLGISIVLLVCGKWVFPIWTAGRLQFDPVLMSAFLAMSAANVLGRVSSHALVSTNRMYGPSFAIAVCTALALVFGALLSLPLGAMGMVLGGLLGELAGSIVVVWVTGRWLGIPPGALTRELLSLTAPLREARRIISRLSSSRPA